MNLWLAYLLLIAIGLIGGLGDIFTYQWAKSHNNLWFVAACAIWFVDILLFGLLLRYAPISLTVAYTMTLVFHTLIVVACDLIYYGARLNRMEWVGIIMAILSVVVLELARDKEEPAPEPAVVNQL